MANIDAKFEVWKNKLLDLGKRNRLLNYRDTARSTIKVTYPNCLSLYEFFVKNENTLVFPYESEFDEDIEDTLISNIKTNKNNADLQKALRNIRNKAKTAIEEQGVNILYLSFGFLHWTETGYSNQIFTSPLVLVPVSITVESISSPYVLSLHEDEIVLNPTLVYKLENDFGIILPSIDDFENLNDLLLTIKEKTSLKDWNITYDASLSLLSFLKINMYTDLNRHKEDIIANPIVRAIGGDASTICKIPDGLSDYNFDKNEKPLDLFQVVDADASQQEAILLAKRGVSFVLQGPPGTGKSQTITNIIAEILADGKKVLFVSEKMAALDVVHRRLANAGLDDFCLVLHSYKANKRNVLEQLGKVLDLSRKKATLSDEAYQKLDILQIDKEKLNEYANQVYTNVEPLGKSIYEVNGIIANLDTYEDFIFSIDNIRNISKEKYNRYSYVLWQFATTIGKMTDDFKSNPWRGASLSSVTNEFRHDVNSHLDILILKIKKADKDVAHIFSDLCIDIPHSVSGVKQIIAVLSVVESAKKIPSNWILKNDIQPLFDEIKVCNALTERVIELRAALRSEYSFVCQYDNSIITSDVDSLDTVETLLKEQNRLTGVLNSSFPYSSWSQQDISDVTLLLSKAKSVCQTINLAIDEILETYEPTIFEIDYKSILSRIKTEYTTFTKIFKKQYKADKKLIQLHHKEIIKKITDEELLAVVEKLRKIDETRQWYSEYTDLLTKFFGNMVTSEKADFSAIDNKLIAYTALQKSEKIIQELLAVFGEIEAKEETLKQHYQFLYNGILSNWEEIQKALRWAISFKESIFGAEVSKEFVENVCQNNEFIDICAQRKADLEKMLRDISFDFDWFTSIFETPEEIEKMIFTDLYNRLNGCLKGLSLLEEWIDFRSAKQKCINEGLEDFISVIERNNIPSQNILPIFKKRFFRLWLDAVLPEFPAVLNFRRKMQETTINEFATLDKVQFEIAKARIKSKLINDLPSLDHFTSGVDEISILKKELSKRRRILPIRKLFKAIPNLLLTLKPCLMMSPLSVSLFLEEESYQFDVVIFDEASQVRTENAIGAIARAKQVIIAGDSRQLPPTNFFQATVNESDFDIDEDEDDFDDSEAYESILDEANMLPERTLCWHYRSRDERLIAFSNAKIYKNNLITFPSNVINARDNGVEYVYVSDGYYDRGGKKGNVKEARKIVDLVFNHFREHPNRSLGIIAFGEIQQQAIETVLRQMRIQNQEFEPFFAEDKEESFFVKNLENVQGDERDTIIFSIGYAKDAAGVFRMNFGPLSMSGGERRLNVAITRAKYNIKLVGSIMPADIDVDKIKAEGPKLLRSYIDFAINGPSVLQREITESDIVEHDSPFEAAVYNFLDRKGYKLGTQVGCSGYRIDMAVKHPTLSSVYVLGIECDGASYHSARTARERDRLRQDVLENMGWKIYRIWSTDWIKDPITEGQRLLEIIEDTITNYGVDDEPPVLENEPIVTLPQSDDFINVEQIAFNNRVFENPYGFARAKKDYFSSLGRNEFGDFELTDCLMAVVQNEFPVHYELLCQRLAPLYGNEKATVKIRREVDYGLTKMNDMIVRKGDFFFPKGYSEITVKMPNDRKIQHISTEELAQAMYIILTTCIGPTREGLCAETKKAYGFNRAGQNIQLAMANAVEMLINSGRVIEIEGKLRIVE